MSTTSIPHGGTGSKRSGTGVPHQACGDYAVRYRVEFELCVLPAYWPVPKPDGTVGCSCWQGSACDKPGKHPMPAWSAERVTAPRSVRYLEWMFGLNPWANISLLTGKRSGWMCADVDPRHGGTLEALWALGWPRATPAERTGSGGWHVYVRCPEDGLPTVHGYAPGIEVLADGGQVIMAPSLHASGRRYAWVEGLSPWNVPVAELPAEVLAGIRKQLPDTTDAVPAPVVSGEELARRLPRAARLVDIAVDRAHRRQDGGRHHTMVWLGNRLALLGLRDERLASYLFEYQARVKGGWSE